MPRVDQLVDVVKLERHDSFGDHAKQQSKRRSAHDVARVVRFGVDP